VKVVASAEAVNLVRDRGGRLYVWATAERCCSGAHARLRASTEPDAERDFDLVPAEGFVVFFARMGREPEELHVDVRGRRKKRIEAYWDNCAWIV
jgi:hypothetical protein